MEFADVVRRRRMWRNFDTRPIPPDALDRILEHAQRAPSAGFSQGFDMLVLEGEAQTGRFWDATFPEESRDEFRYDGLFKAPVVLVPLSHKDAYLDRYAEPDKGWADRSEARWPVPYWHIDTAFSAMLALLSVVDEGLGALFFGIFGENVGRFREAFGVPAALEPIGAIALGYAAPDELSPSLARGRRPVESFVHRGAW